MVDHKKTHTYPITFFSWEDLTAPTLYEILKLRQEVFTIEQRCFYLDCDDYDQGSFHLLMRNSHQKLVGYARIPKPGSKYPEWSIGRVAVLKEFRSLGLGKVIVQAALDFIKSAQNKMEQNRSTAVKISAQAYLEKFYSEFGFKVISEPYLDAEISHVDMRLAF